MCISAAVIAGASLLTAAVGTAVTIDNANYQAKMTEYQLLEQQKVLNQQRDIERLRAMEAEQARLDDFYRMREANLAALAVNGTGQQMSYFQGIEPAEQQALAVDLRNIRIAALGGENRIASEIRVNKLERDVNQANRSAAVVGAGINFAGQAIGAAQYYSSYKTPRSNG